MNFFNFLFIKSAVFIFGKLKFQFCLITNLFLFSYSSYFKGFKCKFRYEWHFFHAYKNKIFVVKTVGLSVPF